MDKVGKQNKAGTLITRSHCATKQMKIKQVTDNRKSKKWIKTGGEVRRIFYFKFAFIHIFFSCQQNLLKFKLQVYCLLFLFAHQYLFIYLFIILI